MMLQNMGKVETFPEIPELEICRELRRSDIGPSNIVQRQQVGERILEPSQGAWHFKDLDVVNRPHGKGIRQELQGSHAKFLTKPRCQVIPIYKKIKFTIDDVNPKARDTLPSRVKIEESNEGCRHMTPTRIPRKKNAMTMTRGKVSRKR